MYDLYRSLNKEIFTEKWQKYICSVHNETNILYNETLTLCKNAHMKRIPQSMAHRGGPQHSQGVVGVGNQFVFPKTCGCFFSSVITYWWCRWWWTGLLCYRSPSEAPFSSHAATGTPPSDSVEACGPFMYLHLKPDEAQNPPWALCACKCLHMQRKVSILFYSMLQTVFYVSVWVDPWHFIIKLYRLHCVDLGSSQAQVFKGLVNMLVCMLSINSCSSSRFRSIWH